MKLLILMFSFVIISCGGSGDNTPVNTDITNPIFNTCDEESYCHIFVASTQPNGDIGGIAGADNICNSDDNKPSFDSRYKALIVDGVNRVACITDNCVNGGAAENVDWVLLPTKEYRRDDNVTVIGTTNTAGIFDVDNSGLNNLDNSIGLVADIAWTGFTTLRSPRWVSLSNTCDAWTSTLPSFAGAGGDADSDRRAFGGTTLGCNFNSRLYCVEQ